MQTGIYATLFSFMWIFRINRIKYIKQAFFVYVCTHSKKWTNSVSLKQLSVVKTIYHNGSLQKNPSLRKTIFLKEKIRKIWYLFAVEDRMTINKKN